MPSEQPPVHTDRSWKTCMQSIFRQFLKLQQPVYDKSHDQMVVPVGLMAMNTDTLLLQVVAVDNPGEVYSLDWSLVDVEV